MSLYGKRILHVLTARMPDLVKQEEADQDQRYAADLKTITYNIHQEEVRSTTKTTIR